MALKLEQKQEIVSEVNAVAESALSAVLADYRGLTVVEMTEMRAKARATGVYVRVIRNSLAKRAFVGTEYECLAEALTGPTLVAFSQEDPGAAARLLKDYAEDFEKLEVKALAIGGQMLGADQLDQLAKLPTRDEALAMMMSVMLGPITKLTRTVNEVPGKLVRTLAAIKDQKEAA
ncbi:MAG: 50S ribosomal protein L10 [Pseudomonadales bacterium]|nr:50S ribosomal protein L10 [Pseudomonadales bacterium]